MRHALNAHQQKAVEAVNGRVLILAGAGSGKTGVLTHRIAYLINHLNVPAKSILGLTFTNKAAAEMRHRMKALIDDSSARQVTLSTFHSFCLKILRSDIKRLGYTTEFSLYNEYDVKRLINTIARDFLDINAAMPSLAPTMSLISSARSKGLRAEEIVDPSSAWHQEFVRTLYQRLQYLMRAYNAVDFDQLLSLSVELFETHPDVLEKYQDQYRYVMIDEYQDTNPVQYRLAALLSAKYNNLCVVGDDDQSIYGWRGADMRNILDFSDANVIKLEQNYRSTGTILKAANAVIGNNTTRHQKTLWSDCGEGEPIELFVAPDEVKEAEAVVARILKHKETHGLAWKDIAILYRSNSLSRQFELALMKTPWFENGKWVIGIPYRISGSVEFYERREVKDLSAYLRVIVNRMDEEALLRIINQPRRGIGEIGLDKLTAYNRINELPLWQVITELCQGSEELENIRQTFSSKALNGLKAFVAIIEEASLSFSKAPLHEALSWLVQRIDYAKAIRDEVQSQKMRDFKLQNVQEFVNCLAEFENQATESVSLVDFLGSLPLQNEWDFQKNIEENKINLMTFHSAKGLEFQACFLVGLESHIIPHEKCVKGSGIEEERRLMYVAMTRAMKYLTLSMAMNRPRMGKNEKSEPSLFLFEIPQNLYRRVDWKI